jgi:CBS domain-containing protein
MLTVKDIITKNVVSIGVDNSVLEANEIMSSNQLGCLVIINRELPIGIVTERDIVRRAVAKKLPLDTKISEIMSQSLITVDADASLKEATRLNVKQ